MIGAARLAQVCVPQRISLVATLVLGVATLISSGCLADPVYWPKNAWRTSSPEAQGLDSASLAEAFAYVREHHLRIHSLLIVRNGYVLLDAYFYPFVVGERHDVASVTKSITSTLVGISIGKGQIRNVHEPVLEVFTGTEVGNRDERKDAVTLESLLTMTSGLDCQMDPGEPTLRQMQQSPDWVRFVLERPMAYSPGTHFEYCSPGMHLLSGVLSRAAGEPAFALARRELFAPLGIRDVAWPSDGKGVTHGWGDLELEPRDMAKIGYLWLNEGRWGTRQIAPADYLRAATRIHSQSPQGESYGYGLWVHPGVAGGYFEALGRGGQRITVLPSKRIVLAITGGGFEPGDIAKFLFDAIKSDGPLPENPAAAARLQAALAAAAAAPPAGRESPAGPVPEFAARISGKRYDVQLNPWNLSSFSFKFRGHSAPVLETSFADSHSQSVEIGMRGSPMLSRVGAHHVLASGSFVGADTLLVDYDQIGRINDLELRFRFDGAGVTIDLLDKTDYARFVLSGRQHGPER